MRIIPAIDIIDGKCVRLSKGNYNTKKIYNEKPLEVAKQFEDSGIKFLHLVDLDGAKSNEIVNYKTLENICSKTDLKVDFGGGIKTEKDVKIAFDYGANQITSGSIAANYPDRFQNWLEIYGRDKIILGADCRERKISTNGWLKCYTIDVVDFIISYEQKGIKNVICTDISKDGMLKGPSTNLYREILNKSKTNLIASGGISSVDDLKILKSVGCYGAIIGKAIYEGKIDLKQLKKLC